MFAVDPDIVADVELAEIEYLGATELIKSMIEQNAMASVDMLTTGALFKNYHVGAIEKKLAYEEAKKKMVESVTTEEERKRITNWNLDYISCNLTALCATGDIPKAEPMMAKEISPEICAAIQRKHVHYQIMEDVCSGIISAHANDMQDALTTSVVFTAYDEQRKKALLAFNNAKKELLANAFTDEERNRLQNWNLDYNSSVLTYSFKC